MVLDEREDKIEEKGVLGCLVRHENSHSAGKLEMAMDTFS